jgi:inward rectifier potassium channel
MKESSISDQFKYIDIEENDSGFDANFPTENIRLMDRDGSLNVHIKGISRWKEFNIYKRLIEMSHWEFYLTLLLIYITVNALFATIYFGMGSTGLILAEGELKWDDAFFFSTQTFTTLGYGHISPHTFMANIVASSEAFLGLLYFAVATGLVYGRFSNSKARIRFSDIILINDQLETPTLMLRLANESVTELCDLKAEIIISWIENNKGKLVRRYHKLKLVMDHINLLTTSWTILHHIDDLSPCDIIENNSKNKGLEFMVFISAYDQIFDQKVNFRTSYQQENIVKHAKFVPITSYHDKKAIVDLSLLSQYDNFS